MKITFPAISDEDSPYIWKLYCEAMRGHIERIWGWDETWQLVDFEKRLKLLDTVIVVCGSSNVGYLQLSVNESTVYINMIVLDSKSRSKGLGSAVIAELNSLHPRKAIELRCFKVNTKACDFYTREGFAIIDIEENSYLMRKG